jgi:hypothetical protein
MKSDYKQNITFPIILLAFSILIFFSADNSIDAVGLRQVYGRTGIFAAIVIILLWLILQGFWRKVDWLTIAGMSIFFTVLTIGVWYSASYTNGTLHSISWVIISFLTGMSYFFSFAYLSILPHAFIVCLIVTCGIWFIVVLTKRTFQSDDLYWITTLIVVHAAMYLMAISYRHVVNPYQFYDTAHTETHTFYLQGELGGYRDEDDLLFYKCNSFGISCEVIFHEEILQIQGKYPHLIAEQDTIKVFLDSEVRLFTYALEP